MESQEKEQGKKCFIITPIGDNGSETFRMAKGVIESVIKPLLENYGYDDVKPAYEINESGMITTQIINRIIDDDLVICNLTGNNPNVMYELCLRHVVAKPIIHICQNGTTLPFDIKDSRTIFYKNDMLGVQELKSQMEDFLKEINYSEDYIDNPVYNAKRMSNLLKDVPVGSDKQVEIELLQNILDKIDLLNIQDRKYSKNIDIDFLFIVKFEENIDESTRNIIEKELNEEIKKYQIIKMKRDIYSITYKIIANKEFTYKNFKYFIRDISKKYNTSISTSRLYIL